MEVVHPPLLSRIQDETSDDIRATILALQSLPLTALLALSEPILGLTADRAGDRMGLPAASVGLASGLGALPLGVFWVWKTPSRCAARTFLPSGE